MLCLRRTFQKKNQVVRPFKEIFSSSFYKPFPHLSNKIPFVHLSIKFPFAHLSIKLLFGHLSINLLLRSSFSPPCHSWRQGGRRGTGEGSWPTTAKTFPATSRRCTAVFFQVWKSRILHYWKCNFPMNLHIRLLISLSVCHNRGSYTFVHLSEHLCQYTSSVGDDSWISSSRSTRKTRSIDA